MIVFLYGVDASLCIYVINRITDMTEITVEGDNTTDIENLIKRVGYINSREFPTPGRRNLHLTTKVM